MASRQIARRALPPQPLPGWRVFLILTCVLVLGSILAYEIVMPAKRRVAERFLARGDSYFIAQQYDEAQDEYRKALKFNPGLNAAKSNQEMARKAPTDIAAARGFFEAHAVSSVVEKLDLAQEAFADPKAALERGAGLYAEGQYSYAQYAIEKAIELDPEYSEAWHYLALTYDQLARYDSSYDSKAKNAFAKRDLLTSKYIDADGVL